MSDSLGAKIKKARKDKGFTLKHLEKRIGWSHSLLSRIESNKRQPEDATLLALAKELNNDFDLDWLKQALSYQPILSAEEVTDLVNQWIGDNEFMLNHFVVVLADKNQLFSEILDKKKFVSAKEKFQIVTEMFDLWDEDYEEKRKLMYDHINSNPELVKELFKEQKKIRKMDVPDFGKNFNPKTQDEADRKTKKAGKKTG